LIYNHVFGADLVQEALSQFGSEELGKAFKRIARNDEIKSLVESAIKNIIDGISSKPGRENEG
jgi:hypothetical protein